MKSYQPTFQQEVGTLGFSVALAEDKLTIMLRDYVDQAVYSRDYTKDDVGAEIDSRVSLTDIWTALSQPITDDKGNRLQHYEVGSVVKCGGSPSYKIGKGGRVTVFHTLIEESTKEQTTYESNLTLTKVNYITEIEKVTQTAEVRDNNNFEQIHLKNRQLQKRVANLEEESKKIKAQLETSKSDLIKNTSLFQKKLTTAEQTIGKYEGQLNEQKNQLSARDREIQAQKTKITQLSKQLSDQSSKVSDLQKQLSTRSNQLSEQSQLLNQHSQQLAGSQSKFPQLLNLESKLNSIREMQTLNSLPNQASSFMKVGFQIQMIKSDGNWSQYIFNKPIYPSQSFKFKLKIVRTQYASIMVGVVDYAKEGANKSSYKSGNALTYEGYDGTLYPQRVKVGGKFKESDVVEVEVNRANKTIKYSVSNTLKATQTNSILDDVSRVFYPYVELNHHEDSVEWLFY